MIMELILLVVLLPIAFLPTIIAIKKDHEYKVAIVLVNILGGLIYGLGWLVALIWCFIEPDNKKARNIDTASEIEKLYKLKEKGILSEEEFEAQKKVFLQT